MNNEAPVPFRYELWNFFATNHNLNLTESELVDVIEAVKTQLEKEQSHEPNHTSNASQAP